MTNSEIVAQEIAERFWMVNIHRIENWIQDDLADNENTPSEFGDFAHAFKVNDDLSDMTLEAFINTQLDFLDLNNRDSITTKLWNKFDYLYAMLVNEITAEEVNTNDERREYYASVL